VEDYTRYVKDGLEHWPPQSGEACMREITLRWEALEAELTGEFSNNQKGDKGKEGIALFLQYLFWSNGQPVCLNPLEEALCGLSCKPFNAAERISFLLDRPDSFQAFKQLSGLFLEQRKLYAAKQAMTKRKIDKTKKA
ncbi:MAG TPA: hypothetical protein VIG80_10400, partial [Bacillaceae bacterium]